MKLSTLLLPVILYSSATLAANMAGMTDMASMNDKDSMNNKASMNDMAGMNDKASMNDMVGMNNKASMTVKINESLPQGNGKALGTVTVTETAYGLLFTPHLTGLAPGIHGFHLHEKPSCAPGMKDGKAVPALAAGGHFDPNKTGVHLGPYNDKGHLGDLPGLVVNADGTATYPVLAPRLKSLSEVKQHALMIHAGGDNYSDHPMPLGGGGARMACGVIE